MPARKANGFTLVEVLVVMVIIGVLAALLTSAISASRESSRRAACLARQQQLAQAALEFEMSRGRFPGWREQVGDRRRPKTVGWAFVLLPFLERKDLFRTYGPGGPRFDWQPAEHLEMFICPSDPPAETGGAPLGYAANCGLQDGAPTPWRAADHEANGIFHDADPLLNRGKKLTRATLGYVRRGDGTSHTLLFSDRVEARSWTDFDSERRTGILWQDTLEPAAESWINGARPPRAVSTRIEHARPSSFHPGGVNVTYADGHTQFLSDDTQYLVYCLMMTPHGAQSRRADGQPVLAVFRETALGALADRR